MLKYTLYWKIGDTLATGIQALAGPCKLMNIAIRTQQKQPYNTSAHNPRMKPVYYIRRSPSMLVVTKYRLDERSDFNG